MVSYSCVCRKLRCRILKRKVFFLLKLAVLILLVWWLTWLIRDNESDTSTISDAPFVPKGFPVPQLPRGGSATDKTCEAQEVARYTRYAADALAAEELRKTHGPLRIAAFSRLWIPPLHSMGGMQFHAFHIYSQLAALGHHVHVFVTGSARRSVTLRYCTDPVTRKTSQCNDPESRLVIQQIPSAQNMEYSVLWLKNCLSAFHNLHAKQPFDVVHSESWAAVPNIHQLGLPFAVTWHGSMLDWFRNELNFIAHNYRMQRKMPGDKVLSRMQELAKAVALEEYMLLTIPQHIVVSDITAKDLVELQHVAADRVALIYNGVDTHTFYPRTDRAERDAFLRRHRVPPEHFVVGCGGRLVDIKGHLQMSRAMRLIMEQHKDVTLLVTGSGPMGALYKDMIREGLSVVMLGPLNQEDLGRFYRSIDVFVDPFYQHHGLNTVMIEAALSGTPLVVTRAGGGMSVVPCTEFGRLFTIGDVVGLAQEILYYKSYPDEAEKVARRANARAIKLFNSSMMAMQYERTLYRLVDQKPPSSTITGELVCTTVYPAMCYREVSPE